MMKYIMALWKFEMHWRTKNTATPMMARRSAVQSAERYGVTDIEGDITLDSCEHLRFSLHSVFSDDFEFFNQWDTKSFMRLVEKARETDGEADILDILRGIQHPDVERAMIYVWHEDPLNHPWMLWGYK
jgi:hypothetical protein